MDTAKRGFLKGAAALTASAALGPISSAWAAEKHKVKLEVECFHTGAFWNLEFVRQLAALAGAAGSMTSAVGANVINVNYTGNASAAMQGVWSYDTAARGTASTCVFPSGNRARPNSPERSCGAAGRSIFTV